MSESQIKAELEAARRAAEQKLYSEYKTAEEYAVFCQDLEAQSRVGRGWKGRVNLYTCAECGEVTVSRDIDNGLTPFGYKCVNLECGGLTQSSMYRVQEPAGARMRESQQWYRPTYQEYLLLDQHALEHVNRGGLLPRKAQFDG